MVVLPGHHRIPDYAHHGDELVGRRYRQRLMRVERAVDPLTRPAGPGAGPPGGNHDPFSPTRWEPYDR